MRVEVAFATRERQWLLSCEVPETATVADAIALSGIRSLVPDLVVDPDSVGIWNRVRPMDTPLKAGDRVEIYRSLKADPKEVRRRRARDAAQQKPSR